MPKTPDIGDPTRNLKAELDRCRYCQGSGWIRWGVDGRECPYCRGTGSAPGVRGCPTTEAHDEIGRMLHAHFADHMGAAVLLTPDGDIHPTDTPAIDSAEEFVCRLDREIFDDGAVDIEVVASVAARDAAIAAQARREALEEIAKHADKRSEYLRSSQCTTPGDCDSRALEAEYFEGLALSMLPVEAADRLISGATDEAIRAK